MIQWKYNAFLMCEFYIDIVPTALYCYIITENLNSTCNPILEHRRIKLYKNIQKVSSFH